MKAYMYVSLKRERSMVLNKIGLTAAAAAEKALIRSQPKLATQ